MPSYIISHTARIAAPAARCYGVIADYHVGHPAIVPPRAFGPLVVEQGGVGAGTQIRFTMNAPCAASSPSQSPDACSSRRIPSPAW